MSTKTSKADFSYPFHQDPNFSYLTGFIEQNALAVIRKYVYCIKLTCVGKDRSSPKGYSYHLFVLPSDPEKEKWDGLPIGVEGAIKSYHADQVSPPFFLLSDLGNSKYPNIIGITFPS